MTLKTTITPMSQLMPSKKDWTPLPHQQKALKFLLGSAAGALFLDPGLGKTSSIYALLKILKKKKLIRKTLVIAPLRVCYLVWPKEQEKWKDFENIKVVVLHGKDKEHLLQEEADVYCINPEGLPWLLEKNFKKMGFDVLVVDESTMFKHTKTNRFKNLKTTLAGFARRYILTGTPTPNSLLDLFGQLYIVDGGRALGQYITHYRNKYFQPSGFGGYTWTLRKGAEKEIYAAIKPVALRLEAEDWIAMPEPVNNYIEIDLPTDARKIYDEMESEMLVEAQGEYVLAETAAAASMKCRQIANGGVYNEHGAAYHLHEAKIHAIKELIDELNGAPVLIAYEFGHDLQRLLNAFGKTTPFIGGGVTPKRSAEIEKAWNAGKIPVLLGQPAAMGHGLNLQGFGNHVIWHSLTWNYEHYDQFNRRVRRQGQEHAQVFIHHIVARNTVDEAILLSLAAKHNTQYSLLTALKEYFAKKKFLKNTEIPLYKPTKMKHDNHTDIPSDLKTNKEQTMSKETSKVAAKTPVKVDVANKKVVGAAPKTAKPAKVEKAAKPATEKKAAAAPKTEKKPDPRKIRVLNKENPHREGSGRAEAFDAMLKCKSVEDYLATDNKSKYLQDWSDSKHIELIG